jgi:hypothetical protein
MGHCRVARDRFFVRSLLSRRPPCSRRACAGVHRLPAFPSNPLTKRLSAAWHHVRGRRERHGKRGPIEDLRPAAADRHRIGGISSGPRAHASSVRDQPTISGRMRLSASGTSSHCALPHIGKPGADCGFLPLAGKHPRVEARCLGCDRVRVGTTPRRSATIRRTRRRRAVVGASPMASLGVPAPTRNSRRRRVRSVGSVPTFVRPLRQPGFHAKSAHGPDATASDA